MKKLIALILAMALALCAAWTNNNTITEVATQTTETKITEWANAYYGKPTVKKTIKTDRVRMLTHRAGRILALPLMIFLGIYSVSYEAKDGVHTKEFTRYGDAKLAHNKLLAAGHKEAVVREKKGREQTVEERARTSSVNYIRKLHLASGQEEIIPMPNSSLIRRVRKMGLVPFDCFMKVDAHVAKAYDEDELSLALCRVQHIAADRLVDKRGCAWKPLLASASDKRKGTFLCVREDLYQKWAAGFCAALKLRRSRWWSPNTWYTWDFSVLHPSL